MSMGNYMNSKRGRKPKLDKFNKDPKTSEFIANYNRFLLHRLNLNHSDKYNPENIDLIIRSILNLPSNAINSKIAGGFLLSCNIEPELYLKIQETAKRITGDYIAMDDLIHTLLTYFCHVYQDRLPKNELPYKHVFKGRRFKNLIAFQHRFGKYYHNKVRRFME
jgi:hypothetical protein